MSPKTSLILSSLFCLLIFASGAVLMAQIDPVGEIVLNPSAGSFWGVAEKDGYVYVATSYGDFAVVDARSLGIDGPFQSLSSTVSRQDLGSTNGLSRHGNTLYLFGGGLRVFDITNPANPVAGVYLQDCSFRNLVVSGDYLFGTGPDIVVVYSITNPSHPSLRATANLGGRSGYAITYRDHYVYVGEFTSSEPKYSGCGCSPGRSQHSDKCLPAKSTADVPYHIFVNGCNLADTARGSPRLGLADPARPVKVAEQTGVAVPPSCGDRS